MAKPRNFDVLIVYNGKIATSASNKSRQITAPFVANGPVESYNIVYGYFLATCGQIGLKAAFTTSQDIIGAGLCSSYWSFNGKKWNKHTSMCSSNLIFDKFSPRSVSGRSLRKLLFSTARVQPFNDPSLFKLFFDKQKTYDFLSNHAIPTISLLNAEISSITSACKSLVQIMDKHSGNNDFSHDIIMKDRFGAGGQHVYKFKSFETDKMADVASLNSKVKFILQPFAKFDKGFTYNNLPSSTDIRLIYLGGKVIQSYIRIAKPNEFRCNEHQGGTLTYLELSEIPKLLIDKANTIATQLNKKHSLYSLDFIITNNGNTYFLEGNTGPGLDWNVDIKENTLRSKQLIRLLAKELKNKIQRTTPPQLQTA